MNNYNIKPISKKNIGKSVTKTMINITAKQNKNLSMDDISGIVSQLNKDNNKNTKYNSKFVVVASNALSTNFNIKAYEDDNIRFKSMIDYLDGRVKDETKFTKISEITITMIRERI